MTEAISERLELLYAIGEAEGADRPGLSTNEEAGHRLFAKWLADAGAEVARDSVGNTFGRLRGRDPEAAEVWVGSHLDSVPRGGRFDGALGVAASVAVLERLRNRPRRRTVTAVAFRDEEGWRFGAGFFGSRAVCGLIGDTDLARQDEAGTTVEQALRSLGFTAPPPGRTDALPEVFVELHVEQGPTLAQAEAEIGVARRIVGMAALRVEFEALGGHAGTVPIDTRSDALVAAGRYIVDLREATTRIPGAVATVGDCVVSPGASNVIPRHVTLAVDLRAPNQDALTALTDAARTLAEKTAASERASATSQVLYSYPPVEFDPSVSRTLERACDLVGSPARRLESGAGHDAGVLASAGVRAGLLFVRSDAGGASHSPDEATGVEAVERAVEALATAVLELAEN
jgi:hydantoinase/carbamoylase family amidase